MDLLLPISFLVLIAIIIGFGFWVHLSKKSVKPKNAISFIKGFVGVGAFMVMIICLSLMVFSVNKAFSQTAPAAETHEAVQSPAPVNDGSRGLGYLAVAIAVGLGSLGAGVATGMSATAAIGAISEDSKVFGSAIIFVGLAEGIAIYGLVIAIMMLAKL